MIVYVNAVADYFVVCRYSVMVPASRLVNVDVRENIPDLVLFRWTVGWWEVF
jgi:hypothetical protein